MKRLLCLLLALGCLAALPGCRNHEERREMRRQLDYAKGYAQPETYEDCALDDGTALEEQVLYDKEGITITAMGIYEDEGCYCIPIRVRNDSEEDVQCYAYDTMTVDGWTVYGDFWLEVVAGGMDDGTLRLEKDSLRYLEGWSIHQIEGSISGYFDGTGGDFTASLSLSLGDSPADAAEIPGTLLAEREDVALWYLGAVQQDYYVTYLLCVENTGGASVFVDVDEQWLEVNGGSELSGVYFESVEAPAGAKTLCEVTLYDSDLDELGLDSFDDIVSLSFHLELTSDRKGIWTMPVQLSPGKAAAE